MDHHRFRLTEREISIIELTASGLSAKEAAIKLRIAPRTVEKHLDNSRLKLHARNSAHLVALCCGMGVLKTTMDFVA
ncbi:response regulator transcription factor [Qipengyuania nanhaisediminis]|uniref:response regulator transcription factor n=1 Tax=Qipengyuania nanhaisediminis TaxID=604088 RepID=UPI0038B29BFF